MSHFTNLNSEYYTDYRKTSGKSINYYCKFSCVNWMDCDCCACDSNAAAPKDDFAPKNTSTTYI